MIVIRPRECGGPQVTVTFHEWSTGQILLQTTNCDYPAIRLNALPGLPQILVDARRTQMGDSAVVAAYKHGWTLGQPCRAVLSLIPPVWLQVRMTPTRSSLSIPCTLNSMNLWACWNYSRSREYCSRSLGMNTGKSLPWEASIICRPWSSAIPAFSGTRVGVLRESVAATAISGIKDKSLSVSGLRNTLASECRRRVGMIRIRMKL